MNTNSELRDRIAAALYRGDAQYACSLIELHNEDIEREIRSKVHSEMAAKRDREMQMTRQATVYFRTRDGLMVPDQIKANGEWPPVWHRPCEVPVSGIFCSGHDKTETEVRTYELSRHRADNGAPIYNERNHN
jgi:hypothetical protein